MKGYIDSNKLIDFCNNHISKTIDANDIARFPTADVAEVKHGKFIGELVKSCDWSGKSQNYYQPHSCSCCHTPLRGTEKYCSNCGAKMDGGGDE